MRQCTSVNALLIRTIHLQPNNTRETTSERNIPSDPIENVQTFPWTERLAISTLSAGEHALKVEKVDCSEAGIFVIYAHGRVLGFGDGLGADTVQFVRDRMFAANVYPSVLPNAQREEVESSVDVDRYWCIPKRVVCNEEIAFGDFGIDARPGRSSQVDRSDLFNLRYGYIAALHRVAREQCLN